MLRGVMAEREGFEPSKQVTPLGGLANRCTRPLCDLSREQRRDSSMACRALRSGAATSGSETAAAGPIEGTRPTRRTARRDSARRRPGRRFPAHTHSTRNSGPPLQFELTASRRLGYGPREMSRPFFFYLCPA